MSQTSDFTAALRGRRALTAKVGMDAHWRGVMLVSAALRDAGMEVVYLGHAQASEIAQAALEEGADLVGLSCLSGNHVSECRGVIEALRALDLGECRVVVGGSIPPGDATLLEELGVAACFGSGISLASICSEIGRLFEETPG